MERNEVRPPVSHVVVYTSCSKKKVCILAQYFRVFTVVWKRQEQYEMVLVITCILRIAAASQEHVLVCITRKVTRPENDMVLVLVSKLSWLLCGWSK